MISPGAGFRKYKNIKRYQQIVSILIKHGFYEFVYNSNLLHFAEFSKRYFPGKFHSDSEEIANLTRWERVRFALEELGPAFVKLGQFVSNRTDLLPKKLCNELENLLDSVSPFDGEEAIEILETELDSKVEDLFSEFNKTPISSASISQVHEAYLIQQDQKVAIKIQRPGMKKLFDTDLEIMTHIAQLAEKFIDTVKNLHPTDIIEDFSAEIKNELNFTNEASNIEKFKLLFKSDKRIYVPGVFQELSSEKVLTMEFIEGIKLSKLNLAPVIESSDAKQITDRMADLILKQVFEFGIFHGDPHPGNVIVMDNNVICFIDFGLVGLLPPRHKEGLSEIIFGLAQRNYEKITDAIITICDSSDVTNYSRMEAQVFKINENYSYLPIKDIKIGNYLSDVLRLILDNKLRIPSDLYMLLKALISLEASVRKLTPDFDMMSHLEPYVKKMALENAHPLNVIKDLYKSGTRYTKLLHELPSNVKDIVNQIKNKKATIQFEHKGLEPMLKKHDQISNRISFSIVTASMLIGSSLIMHAGIPPQIFGVSIVGMITFFFALAMGGVLLISILRHGKM